MQRRTGSAGKSILIIGAGIGGLAAGCYGQMNGYRTAICEMHNLPGGVCTAWSRRGYTFDGCLHHLAGCSPESRLYRVWRELGALPRPVLHPAELVQVEAPDGRRATVYTDLDLLARHLTELAPGDAGTIAEYLRAAKACRGFDLMDLAVSSPGEMLGALPALLPRLKWIRTTMAEAGARLRDPFLRRAFPTFQYDTPANPMATFLNMLAQCETGNFGWPEGGSLLFARDIARRYLDLGGTIHYRARVEKILVEDDRAVGVRLAGGGEHCADVVVSTVYGRSAVMEMLEGRYASDRLRALYADPLDEIGMGLQVSLGVARDLSREPRCLVLLLETPVAIADRTYDRLCLELFGFDPSLAPAGKGVLKAVLATGYGYWRQLHLDRGRYEAEKQRVAETVIACLAARFPGLQSQIEAVDVATPATIERYTGNAQPFKGGPGPSLSDLLIGKSNVRMLPGLADFYLAGQSAGLPGLPFAAGTGRGLIRYLCRRDGKRFGPD